MIPNLKFYQIKNFLYALFTFTMMFLLVHCSSPITPDKIQQAAKEGDLAKLEKYVRSGAILNSPDLNPSPLFLAAENGKLKAISFIVQHSDKKVHIKEEAVPLLLKAIKLKHIELFRHLIESGMNSNYKDEDGMTLFEYAAMNGSLKILNYIFEHAGNEFNIDDVNKKGQTALMQAASNNRIEVIRFLLNNGANPNTLDNAGYTPWIFAMAYELEHPQDFHQEIIELFLTHGMDANHLEGAHGDPPIHYAVQLCALKSMNVLLKHGANPLLKDSDGRLIWQKVMWNASELFCYDSNVLEKLLQLGMSPNIRNRYKKPYLYEVVSQGEFDLAEILLKHGANPNVFTSKKDSPLLCAVRSESPQMVQLLLDYQADPNGIGRSKETPLQIAFKTAAKKWFDEKEKSNQIILSLFETGATFKTQGAYGKNLVSSYVETVHGIPSDLLVLKKMKSLGMLDIDKNGETLAFVAADQGLSGELIDFLGGNVNQTDAQGRTLLMRLLMSKDVKSESVDYLLKKGANPNITDNYGNTPLITYLKHTTNYDETSIMKILLENGADITATNNLGQDAYYFADKKSSTLEEFVIEHLCQIYLIRGTDYDHSKKSKPKNIKYTWPNGDTYEGPIVSGSMHGKGSCTIAGVTVPCDYYDGGRISKGKSFEDGNQYTGELLVFYNGARIFKFPHGQGTMLYPNGDRYTGKWIRSRRTKEGIYTWAHNKASYQGEDGQGVCTENGKTEPCKIENGWWMKDGHKKLDSVHLWMEFGRYYGPVKDNKPHGFGFWKGDRRDEEYWGEWHDGIAIGNGIYIDSNLVKYIGPWVNGIPHGKGICVDSGKEEPCYYDNGDRYEYDGETKNGLPHGKGVQSFTSSRKRDGSYNRQYSGEWKNGQYHGKGKLKNERVIYEGTFRNGKKHGFGKTSMSATYGREYTHHGEYKDDKPHGKGVMTWTGGEQFIGSFVNGKPNGNGLCSKPETDYSRQTMFYRDESHLIKQANKADCVSCIYENGERIK